MTTPSSSQPFSGRQHPIDRRRGDRSGRRGLSLLRESSALDTLAWLTFPVLAVAEDGAVAFANAAFADMVGRTPEAVLALSLTQIFEVVPDDVAPLAMLHARADTLVLLPHAEGSIVRATMSAVRLLGNAELALVTFDDMTERLWLTGQ